MQYANFLMAESEPLRKPAAAATGRDAMHAPPVLPAPLVNRDFHRLVRDATERFRFSQFNRTHEPVPDRFWEAFANCFAASEGTRMWGPATMDWIGGTRAFREAIDQTSAGDLRQNAHNQAVGRNFALRHLDSEPASRAALASGGSLDLNASIRRYWTPADGLYAAPASGAGSRLPAKNLTAPTAPFREGRN